MDDLDRAIAEKPRPRLREYLSETRLRDWLMVSATLAAAAGACGATLVSCSTDATLKDQLTVMKSQLDAVNSGAAEQRRQLKAAELQAKVAELQLKLNEQMLLVANRSVVAANAEARANEQMVQVAALADRRAQEQFASSRRAQLSTLSSWIERFVPNQTIIFHIKYENSGPEPATNYRFNTHLETLALASLANGTFLDQKVQSMCTQLASVKSGTTVGPGKQVIIDMDRNWETDFNSVVNGSRQLVEFGCLAYESLGRQHVTAFCYTWGSDVVDRRSMATCHGGFYRD